MRRSIFQLSLALIFFASLTLPLVPAFARPTPDTLEYGTAWYPEQWPEASWDSDLQLMQDAGFTFVRMAEFSWSTIEPAEGQYRWGWLDRAIAKAKSHNLKVVLGTPTAAPPAWMSEKYPEILVVDQNGIRAKHGGRRHGSVGSELYREKSREIAEKMAARYGRDPTVIGFQIDNEYGRATFDDATRDRFRNWLKTKYTTIAALNVAYVGAQWSLDYSDWSQINIPDTKDSPALYLDWLRFFSEAWRDFQQVQIDAIRPHLPEPKFVTTNYTGRHDNFDFGLTAQPLDLVSWDWYFPRARVDPAEGGLLHDMNRGFLGKNVWVMETAAGNTNWADRNYTMPKGELRAMAFQAVAHGADGYAFWTWRPALNGVEQFHGALVDAGGRPQPVYAEAAQIGREFAKIRSSIVGTQPVADVAILHDYPSRWAIKRQQMTVDFDPFTLFTDYYRATKPQVAGIAVLREPKDLARYKMVVAPMLHLISADQAKALGDYVRAGGHLVLGPRSGVKDAQSSLWMPGQPGPLAELLGAHIDQTQVPPEPLILSGALGPVTAKIWAERVSIDARDVETLLAYPVSDDWLSNAPSVVSRKVGKGRITYVGAWLDEIGLAKILSWAADKAGASPQWPNIPKDVEVTARTHASNKTYFVINWSRQVQEVSLPTAMQNNLTGAVGPKLTLPPYGVAVLNDKK